jgi:16S rRNA (uracil1498-N3)-methyltransferase
LEACTSEQKAIAALIDGADSHFLPPLIRSKPGESWSVFIGPEGDFNESEVSAAQSKGFALVHLGPHRLRTETAGLYAVAAFAQRLVG